MEVRRIYVTVLCRSGIVILAKSINWMGLINWKVSFCVRMKVVKFFLLSNLIFDYGIRKIEKKCENCLLI